MVRFEGEANVRGKVAYVSQQAWMRNTTLRNNILFGKIYKQDVYDKVSKPLIISICPV
jgi:ABC-type multidrug transport system fused ATPase/permease subunit